MRDGVLESLLYSPVRSFFTFGYGGTGRVDIDQQKFELEMDKKRREAEKNYIADRDKRNKYPGLQARMPEPQDAPTKT